MVEIEEPGRKITEADITEYCRLFGAEIPEDYRRFLLEYNGGHPEPDFFEIEDHFEGEGDVAWFYGIGDEVKACDLTLVYQSERDYLPEGHIPIAYSSSGDRIILSLQPEGYGTVWWRDNQRWWENCTGDELYFKLADSFTEFLNTFEEPPDDDDD